MSRHSIPSVLLFAFSVFVSSVAGAATITVTDTGCSLADAIRAADADAPRGDCPAGSGDDLILLDVSDDIELQSALPTINSPVTIQGVGGAVTVDGSRDYRVFDVNGADVGFVNLSITGGSRCGIGLSGGAGLRVRNGSATLVRVGLTNNETCQPAGGAAVLVTDGHLDVTYGRFTANHLDDFNGLFDADHGAAIALVDATATISRSLFGAHLGSYRDSSVYLSNSSALITNSTFVQLDYYGASVLIESENASNVEIVNSTITAAPSLCCFELRWNDSIVDLRNVTIYNVALQPRNSTLQISNSVIRALCQLRDGSVLIANINNWFLYDGLQDNDLCVPGPTMGDLDLLPYNQVSAHVGVHALGPDSDAIDAAFAGECPDFDQRGEPRSTPCDIGALERQWDADLKTTVNLVTPPPYYEGQTLTFSLRVDNFGPSDAYDIRQILTLDNLAITDQPGSCMANSCDLTALPAGDHLDYEVQAAPQDLALSGFTLAADLVPAPGSRHIETNPGNDMDSASANLSPAADLMVSQQLVTPPPYAVGQTIDYQARLENAGSGSAQNVTFEQVPAGLTLVAVSGCPMPGSGVCDLGFLSAGAEIDINIEAQITAQVFDVVASVDSDTHDPNLANNVDDRLNGGNTENDANLKLDLDRLTSGPYYLGQYVEHEVDVINGGPDTATGTVVNMDFSGLVPLGISGACSVLPCQLGNIGRGEDRTFEVLGLVVSVAGVSLDATVQSQQTDPDPEDNTDGDSFSSQPAIDLYVGLQPVTEPPYNEDQTIIYSLDLGNLGPNSASNVSIELQFSNLALLGVISDRCTTLPCTIPDLTLPSTEHLDIEVRPLGVGPFDVTAQVAGAELDPNLANNLDDTGNDGFAEVGPSSIIFRDSLESPQF